jgi:hypothetical protein
MRDTIEYYIDLGSNLKLATETVLPLVRLAGKRPTACDFELGQTCVHLNDLIVLQ